MTDALCLALAAAAAPVHLVVRDDDAGWDDAALHALLDVLADTGTPVDLAVIPDALTPAGAQRLLARAATQPLGCHQHGRSHANHEPAGRKCEFGASRSAAQQRDDLQQGRERLHALLGGRLDPIFTPPWNRCSADTPALLAGLGYAALSRDLTAPAQHALPELPVHVDWTRELREARAAGEDGAARVARALARHVGRGPALGLMLHHAAMDADERALLRRCLRRWQAQPALRGALMRERLAGVPA